MTNIMILGVNVISEPKDYIYDSADGTLAYKSTTALGDLRTYVKANNG